MEKLLDQRKGYANFLAALVDLYNSTPDEKREICEEEYEHVETMVKNGEEMKVVISVSKWHSIAIDGCKGHIQSLDVKFFTGSCDSDEVKKALQERTKNMLSFD